MRRFSKEEMSEIIRTAQVLAPHLTEEQYRKLLQMQQDMANSEFIEASWGVHQLQQEYGIACSETPGKYMELLKETAREESRLSRLKEQRKSEEEKLSQTLEAIRQAKAECHREEKEVKRFGRQAADEKKRLREEVGHAMREAQINREDIAVAVKLKAELESHRLDLGLTLRLFEEFVRDEDAAKHLAEAVVEYGSQLEAREVLRKQNEELKAEEAKIEQDLTEQKSKCHRHQAILSQLRSDLAEQDKLRRFWRRFGDRTHAVEYMAKWRRVVPMRCYAVLCGARFWADSGPTYFRTKLACPCCRLELVEYDNEAFNTLNVSFRGPFRIELGDEDGKETAY